MIKDVTNIQESLMEVVNTSILDNYMSFKYIVFAPSTFYFQSLAEIGSESIWLAAFQTATINKTPDIWAIEEKHEDAKYFTGANGRVVKTIDERLKYRFSFVGNVDYWKKIHTYENSGLRVYFIDHNKNVYSVLDGTQYKGLETSSISVSNPVIGNEYKYFIDIDLSKDIDWSNITVTQIDFDIDKFKASVAPVYTSNYTRTFTKADETYIYGNGNSTLTFTTKLICTRTTDANHYLYLDIGSPEGSMLETGAQYTLVLTGIKGEVGTGCTVRQRASNGTKQDISTLFFNGSEATVTRTFTAISNITILEFSFMYGNIVGELTGYSLTKV